MAARIARHCQQRNPAWTTVEEPLALGAVIAQWSAPDRLILVDCLTIWLSNLLFAQVQTFPEVGEIIPPACFHEERERFLQALAQAAGDVILVSNEVGMGVIPHRMRNGSAKPPRRCAAPKQSGPADVNPETMRRQQLLQS